MHATSFIDPFPPNVYSSSFSMATGKKPEEHKVFDREVYSNVDHSILKYSDELYNQNKSIIPIWILNEINNGRSACIEFPGCEFNFHGRKISRFSSSNDFKDLEEQAKKVVSWIDDDGVNFVLHHVKNFAESARQFGLNSNETNDALDEIDRMLKTYFTLYEQSPNKKNIHFIIVSDNALHSINRNNIIELKKYLHNIRHSSIGESPILQIRAENLQEFEMVKSKLVAARKFYSQLDLVEREDQPDTFLAIAKAGSAFEDLREKIVVFDRATSNPSDEFAGYS